MAREDLFQLYVNSKEPYSVRCPISEMEKLLRRRRYQEFTERFIAIFSSMRKQNMMIFIDDDQNYFTRLFELWFELLLKPSFQFSPGDETLFVLNASITNIMAVTQHKNGDDCLLKVAKEQNDLAKLLLLYTPRSNFQLPIKQFFDLDPTLASLWYASIWNWTDTYAHPVVYNNMRYFMENFDNRFEPFDSNVVCAYFRCTYVDNERDVIFKSKINASIRNYCQQVTINNKPKSNSIAIVSAYWDGQHAVYRAFAPYVRQLKNYYDLSLIHLAGSARTPETSMFKNVYEVTANNSLINLANVLHNDFQLAYFTDAGMSQESMYLANTRLAPIQILSTGHPVSTADSEIDYFISGGEVEIPEKAENNYHEQLVLLPGLSVHPVKPDYTPKHNQNKSKPNEVIINCPWMHMKINYPILTTLKKMLEKSARKLIFQFFPGNGMPRNSALMATMQDIAMVLGIEYSYTHADLPYERYMQTQETGKFTLHSYPFGGGTTAVDALIIGKPLVVWEGNREYNRYSASLLRRLGLHDLIAKSEEEFINISVRLANDDDFYTSMVNIITNTSFDEKIFRVDDADCLRRAIEHLIINHEDIKKDNNKKPIRIK